MTLTFRYGFEHKGFVYGWCKKELYRLPSESCLKTFCLKKLNKIMIGNKEGYRVKRDKFTIEQLQAKTELFNKYYEHNLLVNKDCPF